MRSQNPKIDNVHKKPKVAGPLSDTPDGFVTTHDAFSKHDEFFS